MLVIVTGQNMRPRPISCAMDCLGLSRGLEASGQLHESAREEPNPRPREGEAGHPRPKAARGYPGVAEAGGFCLAPAAQRLAADGG
jgi:hypothetical protein